MSRSTSTLILLSAAILEALGDWMIRKGIYAPSAGRVTWFVFGAAALFAYGWSVNRPPWKFSELLGLYVVFFFLVTQAVSYFLLKESIPRPVIAGGSLIIAGGLVIFLSK
jgi:small multidrug resistance family-3 protein